MASRPKPTAAPANTRAGQGQPKTPQPPRTRGIKVEATKVCYYDDKRRRVGDVFTIKDETEFSSRYMLKVDPATPEKITTGAEILRKEHDGILHRKAVEQHPELGAPTRPSDQSIDDVDEP